MHSVQALHPGASPLGFAAARRAEGPDGGAQKSDENGDRHGRFFFLVAVCSSALFSRAATCTPGDMGAGASRTMDEVSPVSVYVRTQLEHAPLFLPVDVGGARYHEVLCVSPA
jgi:hypothetical protein